jgi:hypothetical protein
MRVLVDTCVFQHASRPPGPDDPWLQEQVAALPEVLAAARRRAISLMVAHETLFELWGAPPPSLPHLGASPFSEIELGRVAPPFHYGRMIVAGTDRPRKRSTDKLRKRGTEKLRRQDWVDRRKGFLRGIRDQEYLRLVKQLGGNKLEDAFLILTAKRNAIEWVLTTDKHLANAARQLQRKAYGVTVLTPIELRARLRGEA